MWYDKIMTTPSTQSVKSQYCHMSVDVERKSSNLDSTERERAKKKTITSNWHFVQWFIHSSIDETDDATETIHL